MSFGNLERNDGSWTTSWKESAELLLERFIPSDEEDACDGSHQHIKKLVKRYQNCNVESPVTREEISRCLKRPKNSEAPGPDGVLYEHFLSAMGKLYERMLVLRVERDYDARGLNSPSQFGFKAFLSAEDAIYKALGTFKNTNKKFV